MPREKVMQRQGVTGTGRWSDCPSRVSHTVYPVKYMVVTGTLGAGFEFYGPFDDIAATDSWVRRNLKTQTSVRIERLNYVKADS